MIWGKEQLNYKYSTGSFCIWKMYNKTSKAQGDIGIITNLFKDAKNPPTATIVINFGCTVHGKGAWVSVM